MRPDSKFNGVIPIILGLCVFLAVFAPEDFGRNDFTEYWSAFQLYRSGGNPYDPAALLRVEREIGWKEQLPLMMWNPPWILPLLSPILSFSFDTARRIFLALNLLIIGFLITQTDRRRLLPTVMFIAISYPVLSTLKLGQLSLLLTLFASLGILLRRIGKNYAAGACYALLSVKPHLFFVFWVYEAYRVIKERNWKLAMGGVFTLLALIVLSISQIANWRSAMSGSFSSSQLYVPPLNWKTASLASAVRELIWINTGSSAEWLLSIFPLIGMVVAFAYRKIPAAANTFFVLALSAVFAPFGWIFDYTLLLPFLFFAISVTTPFGLLVMTGVQFAIYLAGFALFTTHEQFALTGVLSLASGIVALRKAKPSPAFRL